MEPDLQYIHMATPANSRKWANLKKNPNVALLMDDREKSLGGNRADPRALTAGCELTPVGDYADKARILKFLAAIHPACGTFLLRLKLG